MKNYLLLLFLFLSFTAHSAVFKLADGQIKIDVPKGWQDAKNLFGVQLTLLGPQKYKNRPVILIDGANFGKITFDEKSLKKNEDEYKQGREKWISKYNGRSFEYFPYEVRKISAGMNIHTVGYRYEIAGTQFIEHSNYIQCGDKLYNVKSVVLTEENDTYRTQINELVKNFSCL